ncbi:hypothetical protein ANN_27581 [Periplaneta americana]|uniref:Uncharacterized protein n=1 Tax=Periplaneta americana TaxID=6978 RepID=A0ABQ8RWN0_PERAM|nr:hypothetical protein ANN_27581 [Periplaneta americana]
MEVDVDDTPNTADTQTNTSEDFNPDTNINQTQIPSIIEENVPYTSPREEKTSTHKNTTNLRYSYNDIGPFFVNIKFGDNLKFIHPLKIGRWLFQNGFEVTHMIKCGFNQMEVHFRSFIQANKFLDSDFDTTHNTRSFIPYCNLHMTGILRGIDTDITTEEIQANLQVSGSPIITNYEHDDFSKPCPTGTHKCINCGLGHATPDTELCPAYKLETKINDKIQKLPTSRNEARQILSGRQTYAEMVKTLHTNNDLFQTSAIPQLKNKSTVKNPSSPKIHNRKSSTLPPTQPKRKRTAHPAKEDVHIFQEIQQILLSPHGNNTKFIQHIQVEETKLITTINAIIQEAPDYLRPQLDQLKQHTRGRNSNGTQEKNPPTAPGPDGISNNLIKMMPQEWIHDLAQAYTQILHSGNIPHLERNIHTPDSQTKYSRPPSNRLPTNITPQHTTENI